MEQHGSGGTQWHLRGERQPASSDDVAGLAAARARTGAAAGDREGERGVIAGAAGAGKDPGPRIKAAKEHPAKATAATKERPPRARRPWGGGSSGHSAVHRR